MSDNRDDIYISLDNIRKSIEIIIDSQAALRTRIEALEARVFHGAGHPTPEDPAHMAEAVAEECERPEVTG